MADCNAKIGVPNAPNATGAVLAINDNAEAASGEKPSPIKHGARHRDRRAEARRAFEECAEAKRHQQELQPPVVGDAGNAIL